MSTESEGTVDQSSCWSKREVTDDLLIGTGVFNNSVDTRDARRLRYLTYVRASATRVYLPVLQ